MDNTTTIKENKKIILQNLKDKFEENASQYRGNLYDEAKTRLDFIDEFFKLLDWDVNNTQGYSERYREVVVEDKIKIQGGQKAPDYSFRIGGVRHFFVEAKKPSVNVKTASEPAFQIRRYGYSAKLPLSILTNFEEFAVYDTRIKPEKTDDASVARIFYCTYQDYINNFDFLYNTFSRTAILKGRLDRYVEENKNKKGTSEVDKELLKTLESWREELAKNIALNNPKISLHELNLAVQKIVDRIIFLRIAEDKSMENYGELKNAINKPKESATLEQKSSIYKALIQLFDKANTKYNSGLFATLPFLDALIIEDKVFKNIIEGLYYPDCPYEFSILPSEILGSIYEQFLGKTIRFRSVGGRRFDDSQNSRVSSLNTNTRHTAIIEEKPEVKKAGGVYYTPEHIVKYIVERTVGEMIGGKTPTKVEKLRIIDPSCGSGSFLVGAYSYLLAWHLDYYTQDKHLKKALKEGAIYQASGGAYKLTIEKKQAILLNNIFGLDIDEQAVEVAKLSLYLKLLEDEGAEACSRQELFKHTDLKLLPSLHGNIKCGNALVESDYYLGKEASLFEDLDAMREINVFDWQNKEKGFGSIFEAGGFDCVIGNPPYVSAGNQVSNAKLNKQREYLKTCGKYLSLYKQWDLYIPFIEKGLNILKNSGIYGSIIPYPFTNQTYAFSMRRLILENYNLLEIVDLKGTKVFEHATVTNCIPIIRKETPKNTVAISHVNGEQNINHVFEKPVAELVIDEKNGVWNLEEKQLNSNRHADMHVLGDFCYIIKGACCNSDEKIAKGLFKKADLISNIQDEIHTRKYIAGKSIGRYFIKRHQFIEYGTKRSPAKWQRPKFAQFFMLPRLFTNILGKMVATLDVENEFINDDTTIGLVLWKDIKKVKDQGVSNSVKKFSHYSRKEMEELSTKVNLYYLLAILNSNYASHLLAVQRGDYIRIYPEHIRNLPIPIAPPTDMQALSDYAKEELSLHVKLKNCSMPQDKQVIENAIKALDNQIDMLVYKIYGLSKEEIDGL